MLSKTKIKLVNLVEKKEWSHILIKHDQEGTVCIGVHDIYGSNDEEHKGVSWNATPILVADSYDELYEMVEQLHQYVCNTPDVVTEKDLEDFNEEMKDK